MLRRLFRGLKLTPSFVGLVFVVGSIVIELELVFFRYNSIPLLLIILFSAILLLVAIHHFMFEEKEY